jgi:hypothetical protein
LVSFFKYINQQIDSPKLSVMEKQDKRHIPQSSGSAHNAHTRPADGGDNDKLRENPRNDERVIKQQEKQEASNPDLRSGSTFAARDEEGINRVTNEQEQNQVVNPVVDVLPKKEGEDEEEEDDDEDTGTETDPNLPSRERPAEPDYPTENPYEQIGDDPDEAQSKIPRM